MAKQSGRSGRRRGREVVCELGNRGSRTACRRLLFVVLCPENIARLSAFLHRNQVMYVEFLVRCYSDSEIKRGSLVHDPKHAPKYKHRKNLTWMLSVPKTILDGAGLSIDARFDLFKDPADYGPNGLKWTSCGRVDKANDGHKWRLRSSRCLVPKFVVSSSISRPRCRRCSLAAVRPINVRGFQVVDQRRRRTPSRHNY